MAIPTERHRLTYSELESALHEGHTYHPCFKARTGFTIDDHKRYGPEAAARFGLVWLAVNRSVVQFHGPADVMMTEGLITAASQQALLRSFDIVGLSPAEFAVIPLHPWQHKHLEKSLTSLVSHNLVKVLPARSDDYCAGMSLRTLSNKKDATLPDIKLPLSVINTSSKRTICPHSIAAAPAISAWLSEIIRTDKFLQACNLQIQQEFAGITLCEDALAANGIAPEILTQINCLFRDRQALQPEHSQVVQCAALGLTEKTGTPFIHEWVSRYGCRQWVSQLTKRVVIPIWHLLVHHGVALETHGQNLALIHEDGWPTGCVLKDFHESMEFVEDFVKCRDNIPDFSALSAVFSDAPAGQYYRMAHTDELLELFTDTVLVYQLSDISHLLSMHYQFSERDFWQTVCQQFARYHSTGITHHSRITRLNLLRPELKAESLLTRKLTAAGEDACHHFISNPLYQAHLTGSE